MKCVDKMSIQISLKTSLMFTLSHNVIIVIKMQKIESRHRVKIA